MSEEKSVKGRKDVRVRLVWPPTGAEATPLAEDAPAWLALGWKEVN